MNRFFLIKTENVHKLKSRILEYKFSVKDQKLLQDTCTIVADVRDGILSKFQSR